MQPEGRPCLKLLIGNIAPGTKDFVFEGLRYDRVWVQGTVKQKLGAAFKLDDGTGDIFVAVTGTGAGQDLAAGNYVLVVGKLTSSGPAKQPHINAHKVVNLSADPEAAGQRMMHWNSEVAEMQRRVYPLMAAQLSQQQQ